MAKITIEELSGSLKEYLNGLGLTEAQVQELIDKFEDEKIGDISQLSTDEKGSLVGAINELFQNANNGKELIADAIGEPLNADDTFNAMSNDINGLLSTFKTNMMNNGIAVESSDRFKSLIDKIATMVEEGSGKGIQYATGDITGFNMEYNQTKKTTINIDFKPSFIFIEFADNFKNTNGSTFTLSSMVMSSTRSLVISLSNSGTVGYYMTFNINNITEKSFDFVASTMYSIPSYTMVIPNANWYAIGVGEEDTTLRDSLASILQEEGVSVTEEDDMASLIAKVDSEFTKDNNEIIGLKANVTTLTNEKNGLNNQVNSLNSNIENTRSTLAGLMQEGGYNITGNESINTLLNLLVISGISVVDIKQIACGCQHTFVLKTDGSLWVCGNNDNGQLGLGDKNNRTTFTKVTTNINNDVKQVAGGNNHTIILKNDGSVWACGYNNKGQLGLGNTTTYNTFTKVTTNINNDVKQIACGDNQTFILKNDGSVWACGNNQYGQLGLGTGSNTKTTFTKVTTNINNDVKQVACGINFTFILKNNGSIWSCGRNNVGQLGLNDKTDRTTFTQVTTNINNDVNQISCGGNHTFILKNDGSVYSCGNNYNGGLGLGDTTAKNTFTKVTTNVNNVKQIACGINHTFILKNDGSVWACGNNANGNLGLSDGTDRTTFTQVTTNINNNVKQVACGNNHTIILKNDDSIWATGYNNYGNLGLGITTNQTTFTIIPRGI